MGTVADQVGRMGSGAEFETKWGVWEQNFQKNLRPSRSCCRESAYVMGGRVGVGQHCGGDALLDLYSILIYTLAPPLFPAEMKF